MYVFAAIYGYFLQYQTYKMVDFGNEDLINQLDDSSADMLRKLARANDVPFSGIHLTLRNSFNSHEYGKY